MDDALQSATRPRDPSKVAGAILLFGYFLLFGASLMLAAAAWRAYRSHTVNTQWIEAPARVNTCFLREYHPFVHNGGGIVYSLQCRLNYEFGSRQYEYKLQTTASRSKQVQYAISNWAAEHRSGTLLTIRINPSDPQEVAVASDIPIEQFHSSTEALITALGSATAGLMFLLIGQKLGRSGR